MQSVPAPAIPEKQARKLLLLSLKAAYDLEDRTIRSIAQSIGIHQEVLFHLIEVTRTSLSGKEERFRKLQEKRSKLYFRIYSIQEELVRCPNALAKENLLKRLSRLKSYLQKLRQTLSHHYLAPTHRKVAEILGIPKGSIDSTLYYLKKGY
jgi:DNA-binding transcriptional regulator YiaG